MTVGILNWDSGKNVCLTMAILLCGLLATSDVYGQRARGQGGIKGGNVKSISYGKPGTTTQVGTMTWTNGKWVEKNNDGTFEFTEASRDEWSVFLVKSDGMKLQIDLYWNKIKFGGREAYDVLTASASGGATGNSNATYNVTIVTGRENGSGTDSNISLTIHGSNGSTAATVLNPKIAGNAFENGKTDRVTLSTKDVGQINAITMVSDNAYPGSDWFADHVEITQGEQTKKFRLQRWFKAGALQHRVNAEAQANYKVVVKTGSAAGAFGVQAAGTNSKIEIRLNGANGQTRWTVFNGSHGGFEANTQDEMTFSTDGLGNLTSIEVKIDGTGDGPDWYPTTFTVSANGKTWTATNRQWVQAGRVTKLDFVAN